VGKGPLPGVGRVEWGEDERLIGRVEPLTSTAIVFTIHAFDTARKNTNNIKTRNNTREKPVLNCDPMKTGSNLKFSQLHVLEDVSPRQRPPPLVSACLST
jgi:hypothetical protein